MRFKDFIGRAHRAIGGAVQLVEAFDGLRVPRRAQIGKPAARRQPGIFDSIKAGQHRVVTVRSLEDRVNLIIQQMLEGHEHPQIIDLARSIVSQKCNGQWCIKPYDKRGELKAVHEWMAKHFRPVYDPVKRDVYSNPRNNIRQQAGDCDEGVPLEGALLGAIGIVSEVEVVDEKGNPELHILGVAQFSDGGPEVYYDPMIDKPLGFKLDDSLVNERIRYKVFT